MQVDRPHGGRGEGKVLKSVVIIGGGVIGLSAAWAMQKRGLEVTVVEAAAGSHGASIVNAGWIAPALSTPVPSPGLMTQSMRWMLNADSPLYIKPSANLEFLKWLIGFWRSCNRKAFTAGTEATANLNKRTFELFDQMQRDGVKFEMRKDGIFFVYYSPFELDRELRALEPFRQYGVVPTQTLWGRDARELEPSLSDEINGGLWFEHERSVTPHELTNALTAWLSERGVTFKTNASVTGFENDRGTVTSVATTAGAIRADAFVIAAGARSGQLAEGAGYALPIQGGKGYCLDYVNPPTRVTRPVDFAEKRFVCTPMNGFTRLAGTMEFSGINDTIRQARVNAIARGASRGFRDWPADPSLATVSAGLRPMAPDGLPVIGWLPSARNVAVATGHGMLGLTMAAATADELAELITTGITPDVLKPFDPARFR
jgi:D-amino-acid dehydrogenase